MIIFEDKISGMDQFLSKRVREMEESATIAMSAKSRELQAQGIDIISLSLGEPDFNTPDLVKQAAKKAIDENYSKYPPIAGYPELKKAIQAKFKRENNLDYALDEIVVSTGAKQSIANVILALIDQGDEVLLPAPYWVSYAEQIKLAGGIPIEIPTSIETNFKITPKQLSEAVNEKTKMIIYSSPCNPSGSIYTLEELMAFESIILSQPQLFILADEIYEYINFTNQPHASIAQIPSLKERVITVNGIAKGFAMTGWRIGYLGAPKWIATACTKIQGQFTSGANSIAQRATIEALNQGIGLTHEMQAAFLRRRNLVFDILKEIPNIKVNLPEGAFYFFPDVSAYFGKHYQSTMINNAQDLCLFLLTEGKIATVPGDAFGDGNCIRLSYASSDDILIEAIKRIKNTLSLLK